MIYKAFLHSLQLEPHHNPVDKCRQVLFSLFIDKGAEVQRDAWFNQGHKAREKVELKFEHRLFDAISGATFTELSCCKITGQENL